MELDGIKRDVRKRTTHKDLVASQQKVDLQFQSFENKFHEEMHVLAETQEEFLSGEVGRVVDQLNVIQTSSNENSLLTRNSVNQVQEAMAIVSAANAEAHETHLNTQVVIDQMNGRICTLEATSQELQTQTDDMNNAVKGNQAMLQLTNDQFKSYQNEQLARERAAEDKMLTEVERLETHLARAEEASEKTMQRRVTQLQRSQTTDGDKQTAELAALKQMLEEHEAKFEEGVTEEIHVSYSTGDLHGTAWRGMTTLHDTARHQTLTLTLTRTRTLGRAPKSHGAD